MMKACEPWGVPGGILEDSKNKGISWYNRGLCRDHGKEHGNYYSILGLGEDFNIASC